MSKVSPMLNRKSKSVLNERQLELHEFNTTKRSREEDRQKHRQMKRYEPVDNDQFN